MGLAGTGTCPVRRPARTAVDVHLVGPVHEDVCDTWFSEQAVEGSSTQGLATQGFDDGEYDGVAVHTAISPQGGRNPGQSRFGTGRREGAADSGEELSGDVHAAADP